MDYFDVLYNWAGLNEWIFWHIYAIRGAAYDQLMLFLTALGDKHNFIFYLAATVIILTTRFVLNGLSRPRMIMLVEARPFIALVLTLCISFGIASVIAHYLKDWFGMPRPYEVFRGQVHPIGIIPDPDIAHKSLPSGHAVTIAVVVASWWHNISPRLHAAAIALVGLVCWSRVALGMHFPADVVAGTVLGVFVVEVVRPYIYRKCKVHT